MPSKAFSVFKNKKIREVRRIVQAFEYLNTRPGPNTMHSVLHGGLVLLVSYWEVYCEDACKQAAEVIGRKASLRFQNLEQRLQRKLLVYAANRFQDNLDPFEQDIAKLPDGRWRELLEKRLEEYLQNFNTPKFSRADDKDLNGLFERILGINISTEINCLLREPQFCNHVDGIVTLRGDIAHTGEPAEDNALNPDDLRCYAGLFLEASAAIEVIIHREFGNKLGFAPWQITDNVKESIREVVRNELWSP